MKNYPSQEKYPQSGQSLKSLLMQTSDKADFDQRAIRCDCRFFGQSQRKTAIRKGRYKYVYSHDDGVEEFFDIVADPTEDVSLADKVEYADIFKELRNTFEIEEAKANRFQEAYVARKFERSLASAGLSKQLVIISLQEQQINDSIISAMEQSSNFKINAFVGETSKKGSLTFSLQDMDGTGELASINQVKQLLSDGAEAIVLYNQADTSHAEWLEKILASGINVKSKFDINFQAKGNIEWGLSRYWRALASRKDLILNEPTLLLVYIKEFLARLRRKIG